MNDKYFVYVKSNSNGFIIAVNSSEFLTDITGWVEIDSGSGDKFYHAQHYYFEKPVKSGGGAYRYKLVGGTVVECTAEEIAVQEAALDSRAKPTAPRNILSGEYITVDGTLYKATENIPNGESIIAGQNAVKTTIEEQLFELKKGE